MRTLLAVAAVTLSACTNIPQSVRNGTELPPTLEMCHSMFIDSNDRNYNNELEIKHLREEIEQLKKAKK